MSSVSASNASQDTDMRLSTESIRLHEKKQILEEEVTTEEPDPSEDRAPIKFNRSLTTRIGAYELVGKRLRQSISCLIFFLLNT